MKKGLAAIFGLLAACVAGVAIWLYYPQYQIQQLKEESYTLASSQQITYLDYFQKSKKQAVHHVALGDSIITGFGSHANQNLVKEFSQNLEQRIGKSVTVENKGINEITSTDLNKLVQSGHFNEEIKKADIVTINIGGNDILQLGFEKGFYEAIRSFDELQANFDRNLSGILTKVHEINPDATILLLELYNPLDPGFELHAAADQFLPKWNVKLYQQVSHLDYAVVISTTKVINSDKPQNVASDGIHPSARGHRAIAKQMMTELETTRRKN